MATMTAGRWSRARARERWQELGAFAGAPLGVCLVFIALWPPFILGLEWFSYERPFVAVGVYLVAVLLTATLWWRGRYGIGPAESVAAWVALGGLNLALTAQIPAGELIAGALWMGAWGTVIPIVLSFSRPVAEPAAALIILTGTNVFAVARGEQSVLALHTAGLHVGLPIATTATGLVLVVALRTSIRNARRSREQADAVAQEEIVARSIERERRTRIAVWEEEVAPLLDDIAAGRRSARDPRVGARSRALATAIRAQLTVESESILLALLPHRPGVEVTVRDLDVGYRLVSADRIALVALIERVHPDGAGGTLQVTLLPDGMPGEPVSRAIVVLAAVGLPVPDDRLGGTLITEGPSRWWYDLTLRCETAPAIVPFTHATGK